MRCIPVPGLMMRLLANPEHANYKSQFAAPVQRLRPISICKETASIAYNAVFQVRVANPCLRNLD